MSIQPLGERVAERTRAWNVTVEHTLETESSVLSFGTRGNRPVVLKVLRQPGDEWRCGEVLTAFAGRGTVQAYEHSEGAVLLERLNPGNSLAAVSLDGRDEEATEIIAQVIQQMSPSSEAPQRFVRVEDWGKGFQRYLASANTQIPKNLIEQAARVYSDLCLSQQVVRLLHGDLHHYNILFDHDRDWVAIDPKGVVGELEYEIGAALRNPYEEPALFASRGTVERRIRCYEASLKPNVDRMLKWGFSQAVLSAIWSIEDGLAIDVNSPSLMLANSIRALIE